MDHRDFIKTSSSLAWGAVEFSPGSFSLRSPEVVAIAATAASVKFQDFAGAMLTSDMLATDPTVTKLLSY